MSRRADHPFYQQAVQTYLAGEVKTFARLRKAKRLSKAERALLECRANLRDRRWNEAESHLDQICEKDGSFLNADKTFLSATIRFFKGQFEQAAHLNLKAKELYQQSEDRRGQFLSTYNTMVDFSRLGKQTLAHRYFVEAETLSDGDSERSLLFRAMACEASAQKRYEEAYSWIIRACELKSSLSPQDQQTLHVVAVDVLFRAGKLSEALQLLEEHREITGGRNWELARLDFEVSAIRAIRDGMPMPHPPEAVKESIEYGLKWSIIMALQEGEQEKARRLWDKLRTLVQGKFALEFEHLSAADDDSLFGVLLRRLVRKPPRAQIIQYPPPEKQNSANMLERLRQELEQSQSPIRKEELIERLWNVSYSPNLDSRFYKLIERAKRCGIQIISKKRAYSLISI